MAVGDGVIARAAIASAVAEGAGSIGVLVGTVIGENSEAATADVLWENGKTVPGILQIELMKLFGAAGLGASLVGKWVQLKSYPAGGASPKSPAASGVCVRALRAGDYDGSEPTTEALLVVAEGETGRLFAGFQDTEADEQDWVVNDGRRAV